MTEAVLTDLQRQAIGLVLAGRSIRGAAKELGCAHGTVAHAMLRAGLTRAQVTEAQAYNSALAEENAQLRRELDAVRTQVREIGDLHAEAEARGRAGTSPYVVECDECHRAPGKTCRYPNGQARGPHLSRLVKAFYAQPESAPEAQRRIKELESEIDALRRAISPYVIRCPRCGTAAGDRCRHPDGRVAPTHVERIVEAFHAVPTQPAPDPEPDPAWIAPCGQTWPSDRRVRCQQDSGHYPASYHRATVDGNTSVAWG